MRKRQRKIQLNKLIQALKKKVNFKLLFIRALTVSVILSIGILAVKDNVHKRYIRSYVASAVSGAYINYKTVSHRVATGWQLEYKGRRLTITNHHVCRLYKRFGKGLKQVRFDDKTFRIIKMSEKHDLCALEPDMGKPALKLASSADLFEDVWLIGHPQGWSKRVRTGYIVSKGLEVMPWLPNSNAVPYYIISAITYPGNSGSPVVNYWGNVIGVLFAGERNFHTFGLIVPLDEVKRFLDTEVLPEIDKPKVNVNVKVDVKCKSTCEVKAKSNNKKK